MKRSFEGERRPRTVFPGASPEENGGLMRGFAHGRKVEPRSAPRAETCGRAGRFRHKPSPPAGAERCDGAKRAGDSTHRRARRFTDVQQGAAIPRVRRRYAGSRLRRGSSGLSRVQGTPARAPGSAARCRRSRPPSRAAIYVTVIRATATHLAGGDQCREPLPVRPSRASSSHAASRRRETLRNAIAQDCASAQ